MATLIASKPQAIISGETASFISLGIDSSKVRRIYEEPQAPGANFKSFSPDSSINSLTGFALGRGYLIYPKSSFSVTTLEGGGESAVFSNNIFIPLL